jgi:hypothetical protein
MLGRVPVRSLMVAVLIGRRRWEGWLAGET